MASNLIKWNSWYESATDQRPYGNPQTYEKGATYLRHMNVIEDWGCGLAWFRHYVDPKRYRGIDGTWSRFADHVADLAEYKSSIDGIFLRHVLEHDYRWR